jgi:hypothetical protein
MVVLALTRSAFEELRSTFGRVPSPIWVGAGVLTASELEQLRAAGVEITDFTRHIDPRNATEVEEALEMVAMHHPKHTIWVQRDPDLEVESGA